MTEDSESGKNEEKRIEEAQKWQAEAERSLAVAKAKEAHKLIEDTEKSRKRSAINSINSRMLKHGDRIVFIAGKLVELRSRSPDYKIASYFRSNIEDIMKVYESIRYDLMKTLEIKEEELEKLFPRISLDFGDVLETVSKLHCIVYQMHDMMSYCDRILK